jgi:histone-lysine N-methyltransferase SETD2
LRRSDRIKTIENHKIQNKELAITKKLNKLSKSGSQLNLVDENSLNEFDSPMSELANKSGDNSNEAVEFNRSFESNDELTSAQDMQELAQLYEHIDENLYVSVKRKKLMLNKEAKRMACDCSTSEQERAMGLVPCGDDCLNRMLMIECGVRCPCGEYCTNRNFRNKTNAKIRPFKTHYKGWGLKTNESLKGNTFLIEYVTSQKAEQITKTFIK